MEYCKRLMEDQNTVFVENDEIPGYPLQYSNVMFWDDYAERNRIYIDFYKNIHGYKEK